MGSDSMVFYRSFYEAAMLLQKKDRFMLYEAIFNYQFSDEIPSLPQHIAAYWLLIKPQIDSNIKKRENGKLGKSFGKLGGRPKENNPIGDNENNPIGDIEENPYGENKITPNANANVNANVNENTNENIKDTLVTLPVTTEHIEKAITPYKQIVDEYNKRCKGLPKVVTISEPRKKAIKSALSQYTIEQLYAVFDKTQGSPFLLGESSKWQANFDWLIKSANIAKVLDGNYDRRVATASEIKEWDGVESPWKV